MKIINLNLFVVSFLLVLTACSDREEYKVVESDVKLASIQQLYWVNDREVLYWNFGEDGKKYAYIWDENDNKTERYAEIKNGLCYSDGYIHYFVNHPSGEKYEMQGEFTKETLRRVDRFYLPKNDKQRYVRNRYTCTWDHISDEVKDKNVLYLKEEHGYLLTGSPRNNNQNIKYINKQGETLVLPIIRLKYRSPKGFFDFKNAYFLWSIRGAGPEWGDRCQEAWWLYPDGKMESMCVPLIDGVINGSVLVYPFKNGYLLVSHGRGGRNDTGNSGIYMLNQEMEPVQKLLSGQVNGMAISPDGCKAVFRLNPLVNKDIRLTSINLCHQ